jgi:hypothetical protein
MTKRQAIWVLIRACGVYFMYHAVVALFNLVTGAVAGTLIAARAGSGAFGAFMTELFGLSLLRVLVLALIGLYLLRGGQFIFDLVNYEADVNYEEGAKSSAARPEPFTEGPWVEEPKEWPPSIR